MSAHNSTTDASKSNRDLLVNGPRPSNPFVFTQGDTKILVNYKSVAMEGLVSSQALSQASPVLKNFIFPPWNTSTGAGATHGGLTKVDMIDCTEDNGRALLILLDIMHLKFQDIPAAPIPSRLRQIAVLCEQYQCVSIVTPWVQSWTPQKLPQHQRTNAWLLIAWTFGREEIFKQVAKDLVDRLLYYEDGDLGGLDRQIEGTQPPGIIESILQVREETVDAMIALPYKELARYEATSDCICQAQVPEDQRRSYDSLSHGSIIRGLMQSGLYPPAKAASFSTDPLHDLGDLSDAIWEAHEAYLQSWLAQASADIDLHQNCRIANFGYEASDVFCEFRSPVLDSHTEYMRVQRDKLEGRKSTEVTKKRKFVMVEGEDF